MAHGKSTVVKAISGVQTVRFKNELERNITIKLGYANAKIYKCERRVGPGNAAGTEGCAGANQRRHARAGCSCHSAGCMGLPGELAAAGIACNWTPALSCWPCCCRPTNHTGSLP